jgi:hypothetical protein
MSGQRRNLWCQSRRRRGLSPADRDAVQRQLHQARRRDPRRHALDQGRPRGGQRQGPAGIFCRTVRWWGVHLRQADQNSAGLLFYDGRQSWRQRRQPLLGTRPQEVDHRTGLFHLLARQTDPHPLRKKSRPAASRRSGLRQESRALVVGPLGVSSGSTAPSSDASSPARTKRGAAAWPGHSSRRRCCSTTST